MGSIKQGLAIAWVGTVRGLCHADIASAATRGLPSNLEKPRLIVLLFCDEYLQPSAGTKPAWNADRWARAS